MAGCDEAAKLRAIAAQDPRRQRGDDPLTQRPGPAFLAVTHRFDRDPQILNDDVFVTQKPTSRRRRGLYHHLRQHCQLSALGAATTFRASCVTRTRRGRLLHPRGLALEPRARRQSLQTRDLVLQRLDFNLQNGVGRLQLLDHRVSDRQFIVFSLRQSAKTAHLIRQCRNKPAKL